MVKRVLEEQIRGKRRLISWGRHDQQELTKIVRYCRESSPPTWPCRPVEDRLTLLDARSIVLKTTAIIRSVCDTDSKEHSLMPAKKKASSKRTLIAPKGDKRFVRRDSGGKFKESDDVSRSLSQDKKRTAKTKVKGGQGDKGDQKKRAKN